MADPYLTPEQVRERVGPLPDASDDTIAELVEEYEQIAERARGVAHVPRGATDNLTGYRETLILSHLFVRELGEVTNDGTVMDTTNWIIDSEPGVVYARTWMTGPIVVSYEHGLDEPPKVILRGCATYVQAVLAQERSGTSRDVAVQTFDGGVTQFLTPNWEAGHFTGYREVDRLINSASDYRSVAVA